MEVHVCLRHEVAAFDFSQAHVAPLAGASCRIIWHDDLPGVEAALARMQWLVTWEFPAQWYAQAPRLQAVFTPAAGDDWVAADPAGRVDVVYGTFHGPMLAESLLGAMLFLNRRMPAVLANARRREWDRDLQAGTRMLRGQCAAIVGYGSIGRHCARLLTAMGMRVLALQRSRAEGIDAASGAEYVGERGMPAALGEADHVIVLLPGAPAYDGWFSEARVAMIKRGAAFYNFGRGNAIREHVLIAALDAGTIGAAVLDVTEVEPLPRASALWSDPRVTIMPHSSCVYSEYRTHYVEELCGTLPGRVAGSGPA